MYHKTIPMTQMKVTPCRPNIKVGDFIISQVDVEGLTRVRTYVRNVTGIDKSVTVKYLRKITNSSKTKFVFNDECEYAVEAVTIVESLENPTINNHGISKFSTDVNITDY
jgi:hypothetical protein